MKITDDMLSAQAAEARELWLQACTPDALPEHRFSRKFRREMRRAGVRVIDARPPHMETGLATRPIAGTAPGLAAGADPREFAGALVAAIAEDGPAPDWIS